MLAPDVKGRKAALVTSAYPSRRRNRLEAGSLQEEINTRLQQDCALSEDGPSYIRLVYGSKYYNL